MAVGLLRRPESAASRHLIAQAVLRLRCERYAPLLPGLILGVSQSACGAGAGSDIPQTQGRLDLDAAAYWELRHFAFGEVAARQTARPRVEQARWVQVQLMDRIAREIVEAYVRSQSLRDQIASAEAGIRTPSDSYRRNVERIRGGRGLPLELLQAVQALDLGRRKYLGAAVDGDQSGRRPPAWVPSLSRGEKPASKLTAGRSLS